ncbi:MAG: hypothetical protein ACLFVE_00115 [Chitinispirillaceae bacterium]
MGNSTEKIKKKNVTAETKEEKKPFVMSGKHWSALCVALLFLLTVIQFASFLFSDQMLLSSDQITGIDSKMYLCNSINEHHQFPTWFSSRLAGMPTVDAMFGDSMYPPSAVLRTIVSVFRLFGYKMILHVFLAGLFFFLMLRRSFGLSRLIAFTGAVFFMLAPQFISHVRPGHDGKMYVIAWLPFIIWRLRSLLNKPTLRNASILGFGIAMTILTSHIQMSYFMLWGVFLYWVTAMVLSIKAKDEKKQVVSRGVYFWVAVFFGVGLAFVQLFPSYMYVREAFSVRGVDRGFAHATSWCLHWAEFFSLWIHEFGNSLQFYWGKNHFKLNTDYAGMIPLLLSVLAVISKPRSVWRIFWVSIAVLATLFALGENTPLFGVLYHLIPGVNKFRAPSMIMFWYTFSTILLSVFFLKDLLADRFAIDDRQQKKIWTKGLFVAIGSITLLTLAFSSQSLVSGFAQSMMGERNASNFGPNFSRNFVPALWLWWFFCSVALAMLLAVVNGKLNKKVLFVSLMAMCMVDMMKVNSQFIDTESQWKHFYRSESQLDQLKEEFEKEPFRVYTFPNVLARNQNQEGVYGLEGVGGFHDNELVTYREFRGDQSDKNYLEDMVEMGSDGQPYVNMDKIQKGGPFLDLADVRYVLSRKPDGELVKIRNKGALGRLSYASDYVVMNEDEVVTSLKKNGYDYRTTVALSEEPKLPFSSPISNSSHEQFEVEWEKYTPNKRVAQVVMPSDGFLRISEVHYPGWRIMVDGSEVDYYKSDVTWMTVPLKAGEHLVEMEPKSLYLNKAALVSFSFLILMLGVWGYELFRNRKSSKAVHKG